MKTPLKTTLFCAYLMGLAGCSGGDAGDNADPQGAQGAPGARTVEAGPLQCLLQGDGTGSRLASVTCAVAIGNSQASTEGIDVSVTNILQVIVLPDVCPSFYQSDVLADSHEFDHEVQAGLSAAYLRSGIGWTVGSVACQVSVYPAP